jgi:DNA invertase Pin-like site-specific DNA recombinase
MARHSSANKPASTPSAAGRIGAGAASNQGTNASPRQKLRCAIYTRKSSEEGLEQSFNSLHAQRDACEAFVASQKHEGWMLLPTLYDDGGLSGGSMKRPALQQLLEDVQGGLVDIVVVYKVDRLTRSLADFAKLTELFDAQGASFVSVTQAFNTSTSMGRLTLNVLLSFAQFEREVAGERIRDKIALSKRRGMWMGGLPPLGYDHFDRQLVVNGPEAETVRRIFAWYLECGSVAELKQRLNAAGIVSKRRRFTDGREAGGVPMSRGALYQLLGNRLYRGEIAHRGEIHKGNHLAIVEEAVWNAVRAKLDDQSARPRREGQGGSRSVAGSTRKGAGQASRPSALLQDLAFDADGHRLTPSHTNKRGRRYRYYVSAPLVRGGKRAGAAGGVDGEQRTTGGIRVPASDLEQIVAGTVTKHLRDAAWAAQHLCQGMNADLVQRLTNAAAELAGVVGDGSAAAEASGDFLRRLIARVIVSKEQVTVSLDPAALSEALTGIDERATLILSDDKPITIEASALTLRCGKQIRLVLGTVESETVSQDPGLLELITSAHGWFEDLRTGRAASIAAIGQRDHQEVSHVSRTLSLAFLAPDIVEMILAGRQPTALTPERLKAARPLPLDWNEQRARLLG